MPSSGLSVSPNYHPSPTWCHWNMVSASTATVTGNFSALTSGSFDASGCSRLLWSSPQASRQTGNPTPRGECTRGVSGPLNLTPSLLLPLAWAGCIKQPVRPQASQATAVGSPVFALMPDPCSVLLAMTLLPVSPG